MYNIYLRIAYPSSGSTLYHSCNGPNKPSYVCVSLCSKGVVVLMHGFNSGLVDLITCMEMTRLHTHIYIHTNDTSNMSVIYVHTPKSSVSSLNTFLISTFLLLETSLSLLSLFLFQHFLVVLLYLVIKVICAIILHYKHLPHCLLLQS